MKVLWKLSILMLLYSCCCMTSGCSSHINDQSKPICIELKRNINFSEASGLNDVSKPTAKQKKQMLDLYEENNCGKPQ